MDIFFKELWRIVRREAPPTSIDAAKSILSKLPEMERLVYDVILEFDDGCIQDDVLALLPHYPYSSVTARFRALLDKGLILDTGLTRPGKSGRRQRVVKTSGEQSCQN